MSYDSETIAALAAGRLVLRDLLTIEGWDGDDDPATFGFWTGEDDISVNVVSGTTGSTVSRNYIGGGSLLTVPPIIDSIGLDIRPVDFGLSHLHDDVLDMLNANRIRGGHAELHRVLLDPATWEAVSEAFPRFVGRVDEASRRDAAVGGEGGIVISCSPDLIDLTRTNPALKSDATQQALHGGDRFRRYDNIGQVQVDWGRHRGGAD